MTTYPAPFGPASAARAGIPKGRKPLPATANAAQNAANRADAHLLSPVATRTPRRSGSVQQECIRLRRPPPALKSRLVPAATADTLLNVMAFEPLTSGRYWILAAWLPFFVLNIVGEEFLWRGVVLPRQEVAFGGKAWLVNGTLWLLFHAAFPWQVLLILVPITLIVPNIAQRRRNSWPGVVIHAGFGGMGFLALAFGLT